MFNANSREEIKHFLETDNHKGYVIEAGTGVGKTYLSLLKTKQWTDESNGDILIVIPKKALEKNWIVEFEKFGYEQLIGKTTFTCYNSLQKHVDKTWNTVIFDEVHHLSDRCKEIFKTMKFNHFIGLSATLKKEVRNFLYFNTRGLETIRLTLRNAIDNGVIPNPKIILIPLWLDNSMISEVYVKNPKAKKSMEVGYKERMLFKGNSVRYNIHCTQAQKNKLFSDAIDWLKSKPELKNAWLYKCGERLKWLSEIKTDFVKEIMKHLTNYRTIVFCNSIEQTHKLGRNSINSKDGIAQDVLDAFNERKINRVTSVGILNEGINVTDCRIGIFANLNSSDLITKQRSGRILRHEKPVIIIPYYKNTRDEEIVTKMIRNYDENMIVTINDLNELKEHLK